jgi:PAS domain-containing protein
VHIWEFKNNLNGHWYHCIDKAINWLDGRSVRFEMAIDITEHKNLVEELKEKEKFFTDVFSSIQDGISILDKEMFAQPRKL